MTRQTLIAGNWKMYKPLTEAIAFAQGLKHTLAPESVSVDVVVAPPYPVLYSVAQTLQGCPVAVGAQNVHDQEQGAYTGEVSAPMLKEVGCTYAIIGHSERRQLFSEDDGWIEKKLHSLLKHQLQPILCLGETLQERQQNQTEERVSQQLRAALRHVPAEQVGTMIIAYEPVWAIGTGLTATPEQAQEIHALLRRLLQDMYNADLAQRIRILYGGSVKPNNIRELIRQPDIDGALIGGASLDLQSFLEMIHISQRVTSHAS